MIEQWKDIPGYECSYQASNMGYIKSLKYGRELILKMATHKYGYKTVVLTKDGKQNSFSVHQLIAMAFLDHKPDGFGIVVNHIDNNPLNNRLDNLELVTQGTNTRTHKTDVGISWNKREKKWVSLIRINGPQLHLGYFKDKQEALDMYQKALANIHLYGGDAKVFRKLIDQLDV